MNMYIERQKQVLNVIWETYREQKKGAGLDANGITEKCLSFHFKL